MSVAEDGTEGNNASESPSISADGRFVAFESYASNLVSGDTNADGDIFVYDRQNHRVERMSVADDGSQGNAASTAPAISADGRLVTFQSAATNLVNDDDNGVVDVFVRRNLAAVGAGLQSVSLYAGEVLTGVDFSLLPEPGEIRGRCFEDVLVNGVYDIGEPLRHIGRCVIIWDLARL